jgi:aspartyl-tRNA synthetase
LRRTSQEDVGDVQLCGWVDATRPRRPAFIHLRDRSGIVKIVFSPDVTPPCCQTAATLVPITAFGDGHRKRMEGTENPNIETGKLEVFVDGMTILSESDPLPFVITDKAMVAGGETAGAENVSEDLRMQYRYLDIRRPAMQNNLLLRQRIFQGVRQFLDSRGFVEVETPVLTASTPEGARDYLVPSRVHPQNFYALPQSPQLFKQLLMIGGLERYFQLARCFRDEDLRPNRQPEFTQLDIEASFIDEEFLRMIEELRSKCLPSGN